MMHAKEMLCNLLFSPNGYLLSCIASYKALMNKMEITVKVYVIVIKITYIPCRVTKVFGMLSVDSPTRYRFNITGESSSFPVHIRRCVPSSPQLLQGLVWSSTNRYKMSLLLKEIKMCSFLWWLLTVVVQYP